MLTNGFKTFSPALTRARIFFVPRRRLHPCFPPPRNPVGGANQEGCLRCSKQFSTIRPWGSLYKFLSLFRKLKERINDRCSTYEQLISTIYEQGSLPIDDTIAEDWMTVSYFTEANNSVVDECQMNPDVTHVHERRTCQLCHVRRLVFPLNIDRKSVV